MESRQDEIQAARSWLLSWVRRKEKPGSSDSSSPPNERTSLARPADEEETGETHELRDDVKASTKLVAAEFCLLLKASVPVFLAYMLQNSLQTISVLIVGRLSPEALATAAFSYMFAMATGWLIALGGTTAIDTLASATFTGSKNPHDLGVILQRSLIVLGLFYLPVALLWIFSEPVFKLLGQEDYIAASSSKFLAVLLPGGLGYIYFECLKKYLQAQGKLDRFHTRSRPLRDRHSSCHRPNHIP